MSDIFSNDAMLDMYIFETTQLIEQLEQNIINNEKAGYFTEEAINEVFRIMHTIKGSSAMMMFDNISTAAHSVEDLFYFVRENKPAIIDYSKLSDIVLDEIDFIKTEVEKIINKNNADVDNSRLLDNIKNFLAGLRQDNQASMAVIESETLDGAANEEEICSDKTLSSDSIENWFSATIYFEEGCEMEDMRAFSIIHNLKNLAREIHHIPEEIFENENSVSIIRKNGFQVTFKTTENYDDIYTFFMQTGLIREFELTNIKNDDAIIQQCKNTQAFTEEEVEKVSENKNKAIESGNNNKQAAVHQSIISVNVTKLDKLMDIIGELVISEAMVVENPDLKGISLGNFQKAARQLEKITGELQDIVMSIRMVPLNATFHKMNRIVRDMSKKLSKKIKLEIIGEDTEVDKNIIEHISDPLMHLIRNAIDHGLETPEIRRIKGKQEVGTVTLEAKNEGNEVLIIIRDDGKGLSRDKILEKARKNGIVDRDENEISDKEVFSYIFLPGFSTKEEVTEFSGRGVGMDVVTKNISEVGGSVSIDSIPDKGTAIILKIPLTLAIMDGMTVKVGKSVYTIPLISIKESFRTKEEDVIIEPDGNEMIMIRGQCYPVLKLYELYKVKTQKTEITDGIVIMLSHEEKKLCIFVDELVGEQQVVVKVLPEYIKKFKKARGLTGCTLLGDGSISLILDVASLIKQ